MPTYLEVWEIFLDHEIQMAQIVGWKDGNAKITVLAVTRGGFAEFLLSYKIAPQRQNPPGCTLFLLKKNIFVIFLLPHQETQASATCSWKLSKRLACCWVLNTLDHFGGW